MTKVARGRKEGRIRAVFDVSSGKVFSGIRVSDAERYRCRWKEGGRKVEGRWLDGGWYSLNDGDSSSVAGRSGNDSGMLVKEKAGPGLGGVQRRE